MVTVVYKIVLEIWGTPPLIKCRSYRKEICTNITT